MSEHASSTIAMTAYNVMVLAREPLKEDALLLQVKILQHPDVGAEDIQAALEGLLERNYIVESDDGYLPKDPEHRRVVARSRFDETGWSEWMVLDGKRGLLLLDEVAG